MLAIPGSSAVATAKRHAMWLAAGPREQVARKASEPRILLNYDKHHRPTLGACARSWGGEQDSGQTASRVSAPHAGEVMRTVLLRGDSHLCFQEARLTPTQSSRMGKHTPVRTREREPSGRTLRGGNGSRRGAQLFDLDSSRVNSARFSASSIFQSPPHSCGKSIDEPHSPSK